MENLIKIENLSNESLKCIFTNIQLRTLEKKLNNKPLTPSEKTYYYSYIKPKIKAFMVLLGLNESIINGSEYILPGRIDESTKIISKFEKIYKNRKIMISGSFLYKKDYNDIDLFVFSKYKKDDYKTNGIHVNFLNENSMNSIFFDSVSKISISNFRYNKNIKFEINLKDLLFDYETIINYRLNNENYDNELRRLILHLEYASKKIVLNSKELNEIKNRLLNDEALLDAYFIECSLLAYKKDKLIDEIKNKMLEYKKLKIEYNKANNIDIYLKTYEKVINFAN